MGVSVKGSQEAAADLRLLERLQALQGSLTESEKRMAEALLQQPELCAFESLRSFARNVGVNPSTLSRFVARLQYERYRDLQLELRSASLHSNASPLDRAMSDASRTDLSGQLLQSIEEDVEQIRWLTRPEMLSSLERAVRLVSETVGSVYVIGNGWNRALADMTAHRLALCCPKVESSSSLDLLGFGKLTGSSEKDCALVISTRRYSRRTLDMAATLHKRGVRVIGVTDSPASPLLRKSHMALVVPNARPGLFDSPTPLSSVLHALCVGVANMTSDQTVKRLTEIDAFNVDLGVFNEKR